MSDDTYGIKPDGTLEPLMVGVPKFGEQPDVDFVADRFRISDLETFRREYLADLAIPRDSRIDDVMRGTGRTTRQILSCPNDSIYVVLNHNVKGYVEGLAKHCGRDDIEILVPKQLEIRLHGGFINRWIELDHDTVLGPSLLHGVRRHNLNLLAQHQLRITISDEPVEPKAPEGSDKPAGTEDAW